MLSETGVQFKETKLGLIPENWEVLELKDVCILKSGSAFPKKLQGKSSGYFPFIKVSDMNLPINSIFIKTANNWIESTVAKNIKAQTHPAGAVVFAKIGIALTYNRRRILTRETIIDNNMMSAIPNKKIIDPSYMYYLLCTIDFNRIIRGTALPYLSANDIYQITIAIPPLPKQRIIAKILSTLDYKIELNQQMNRTLDAIGQAVFKHWFVDFEFPNEEGKPYKTSGGKMVDSEELGKNIPKDWHAGTINDLCSSITNGGTPKRSESNYWKGNIAWIKTGELTDGPLLDSEEHITKEGLENSVCKIWDENTVLIALYGVTVGKLGILKIKAAANQACSGLVAKKHVGYPFVFYSLLFKREELINFAVGAAQQNISQQVVKETKTIIPPTALLQEYNALLKNLFEKQTTLLLQNRSLTKIRDILLPKLMFGKIRVPIVKDKMEVS